jgi:hypothetical protein
MNASSTGPEAYPNAVLQAAVSPTAIICKDKGDYYEICDGKPQKEAW